MAMCGILSGRKQRKAQEVRPFMGRAVCPIREKCYQFLRKQGISARIQRFHRATGPRTVAEVIADTAQVVGGDGVVLERRVSSQLRALGPAFAGRAESGRTSSVSPSVGAPVWAPNETSGTRSGGDDGPLLKKSRPTDGGCTGETRCESARFSRHSMVSDASEISLYRVV